MHLQETVMVLEVIPLFCAHSLVLAALEASYWEDTCGVVSPSVKKKTERQQGKQR